MSNYYIFSSYLEHTSGSKFYETVQINEEGGAAVLIKRHGPITSKVGGGNFTPMYSTHQSCTKECMKILSEKRRVRGGGKYEDVTPPSDMRLLNANGRTVNRQELIDIVNEHYPGKQATAVLSYFALTGQSDQDNRGIVDERPDEPSERDANWGAW